MITIIFLTESCLSKTKVRALYIYICVCVCVRVCVFVCVCVCVCVWPLVDNFGDISDLIATWAAFGFWWKPFHTMMLWCEIISPGTVSWTTFWLLLLMTTSYIWPEQWVYDTTCCLKLNISSSVRNVFTSRSVGESMWKLVSPTMRENIQVVILFFFHTSGLYKTRTWNGLDPVLNIKLQWVKLLATCSDDFDETVMLALWIIVTPSKSVLPFCGKIYSLGSFNVREFTKNSFNTPITRTDLHWLLLLSTGIIDVQSWLFG